MGSKLPITIAVLLGGESSRFGSPKAFLQWGGKSLTAHLAQRAQGLASEVLLVGKEQKQVPGDAKDFARFVADEAGFPGPLAGFAAALAQASNPWIFLTGVDMPFLNGNVLREFWKLRENSVLLQAVVPYREERWQPLCALWNRYALKILRERPWGSFQHFLREGGLKTTKVGESDLRDWDPGLLCLRGFNSPKEWEEIKNTRL